MMLDWFILLLLIAMAAVLITSSREVYMYVCLVLGSLIEDIKNFFKRGK
jgi:hypothetical protein